MVRPLVLASGVGAILFTAGCGLFPDLGDLASGDGGSTDATTDSGAPADAASDAPADAGTDSGPATDSGPDGSACCPANLVSAYLFADANNLGHDSVGINEMTTVKGTPKQSTVVPGGQSGYSIELDGSSTVCKDTGYTFDSTSDHTLCWWSRPAALANSTNQFAQYCGYDTWTTNNGADYLWRINNCNSGTAANLQVANTYSIGTWVQICQTYSRAAMKRTVVVNGQTAQKYSVTDSVPIVESASAPWCIGSYGSGGYWTGLIYRPMWFDRVLTDTEIQQVYAGTCCLP